MNSDGEAVLQTSRNNTLTIQNDRRSVFTRLYRSLEDAAYIQCAILFYADQSLAFAFARWNVINNYSSADALASLRIPISVVVNSACILWHLFAAAPEPINTELRGYLSGSTLIDMVGEFPPSKLRLLCLDLLFFMIQVFMLIVSHEAKKLETKTKVSPAEPPAQDIDAEEQGIQRAAVAEEEATESATLLPEEDTTAGTNAERENDDDEEGVPVLRINVANSLKEILEYQDTVDPDLASQRMRSRERLRRLLTALAQRAARE